MFNRLMMGNTPTIGPWELTIQKLRCAGVSIKVAHLSSALEPHQERVADRALNDNLLIAHGMGSGKTLSSIAVADRLKQLAEIFVPAPLVPNFQKEVQKHTGGRFVPYAVHSVPTAVQQGYEVVPGSTMIVDEAHMARNPEALRTKYLKEQAKRAGRLVLLTGTPTYNQPENLAPLVNMLYGKNVLPEDPTEFRKRFIGEHKVGPGVLGWLLGVKPGVVKELKHRKELVELLRGHVDTFEQTKNMPEREEKDVVVEMSPEQQRLYDYLEGSVPWHLRWKMHRNLPPSKQESKSLNSFMSGLRQVSDTPGPYIAGTSAERAGELSPKLMTALGSILEKSKADPRFRGFVYSNYIDAGVSPMEALLRRAGISTAIFNGGLSKAQRKQLVNDYNAGKIKVLLGTSAATEGLDLEGTKLIQVLDPHFNESKTNQAIARGIRFGSHAHLPAEERRVLVERYYSKPRQNWLGKLIRGEQTGVDQYIRNRALEKDELTRQLRDVFREAQS